MYVIETYLTLMCIVVLGPNTPLNYTKHLRPLLLTYHTEMCSVVLGPNTPFNYTKHLRPQNVQSLTPGAFGHCTCHDYLTLLKG